MKRVSPQRISIHRNYTVMEVVKRLGVGKRTVHRWIKQGLPTVDRQRPLLVIGSDLKKFIQQRMRARRQGCPVGLLFCVRCRRPKMPYGNMVDWLPKDSLSGLLRGICPTCGTLIHRATSCAKLPLVTRGLEVTLPRAQRRLNGSASALVDVQFRGGCDAKA
jgi:hypothetical protein